MESGLVSLQRFWQQVLMDPKCLPQESLCPVAVNRSPKNPFWGDKSEECWHVRRGIDPVPAEQKRLFYSGRTLKKAFIIEFPPQNFRAGQGPIRLMVDSGSILRLCLNHLRLIYDGL